MALLESLRAAFAPGRDEACSFCGATRAQVKLLVAGERASICERCVAIAYRVMETDKPGALAVEIANDVAASTNASTPPDQVVPPLRLALRVGAGNTEALTLVFEHALRVGQLRIGIDAMRALADEARTVASQVDIAALYARLHDLAGARTELDVARTLTKDALDRARIAATEVHLRVRWDDAPLDDATRESLVAALGDADRELALTAPDDPRKPAADAERDYVLTSRALIELRARRPADAERRLREALRSKSKDDLMRQIALGDALRDLGRTTEAREAWQAARERLAPVMPESVALDARLGSTASVYR